MRKIILAASVLSLSAGLSYAAPNAQSRYAPAAPFAATQVPPGTPVQTATDSGAADPTMAAAAPNPWQGTESWAQWNKDHPLDGSDGD